MKLADTGAIAYMLKRPAATIRWWAHKGWLTRHGTDTKGRALYSTDQAEQLHNQKLDNASDLHQHVDDYGGSVP